MGSKWRKSTKAGTDYLKKISKINKPLIRLRGKNRKPKLLISEMEEEILLYIQCKF